MGSENKKEFPQSFVKLISVEDQSSEVMGFKGSREGTMVARGWHNNYSEFSAELNGVPIEGCVICVGTEFIIEVNGEGENMRRRFSLDLKEIVNLCVEKTVKKVGV